jgi:hypothetical protein
MDGYRCLFTSLVLYFAFPAMNSYLALLRTLHVWDEELTGAAEA